MNKLALYHKAPQFIKVLLASGLGLLYHWRRYTGSFHTYYQQHKKLWTAELVDVHEYRRQKLVQLMVEAVTYCEWYKQKAAENNITIDEIKKDPFAALQQFPVLTKEERRKFAYQLLTTNPERKVQSTGYTSGTTGSPTVNMLDRDNDHLNFAQWSRFYCAIGLPEKKGRSVRLTGKILVSPSRAKPPFWVTNLVEKQLLMSSYHLTEENMIHYVNKMNHFRPELIEGYPSAIYIIAALIKKHKLAIKFKPIAISTTAETLFKHQRVVIEEAFNCKVFDFYASSEGGPLITECKNGKMHLNLDSGVFEFQKSNNHSQAKGEFAELVVTSLRQFTVPLIRYAIKDIVELPVENSPCGCGCKMPTIKQVIGREDDFLWTQERGFVGRMDTAFKGLEHIIKSQIIQKTPELLEVYSIVDKNYSKNIEATFKKNLRERLGANVAIRFFYVDDIPLGKSGKFIAVKREFSLQGLSLHDQPVEV